MREFVCDYCNTPFTRSTGEANRQEARRQRSFCSLTCAGLARRVVPESSCTVCGMAFRHRGSFCSRSCSVSYHNRINPKRKRTIKSAECDQCGAPTAVGRKFCGAGCQSLSRETKRKQTVSDWLSGRIDGSDATGNFLRTLRNYLLDQATSRCTRCGWGEVNPVVGHPILTIDHIDGNWRNHSPANLRVLCYNCHSLTPTFGSLNRGNAAGRKRGIRQPSVV